jgi:hypothetical protein
VNCAGCQRELEVGDRYIKFTASEWAEREGMKPLDGLDDVFADLMGSGFGKDIVFCDDCTESTDEGWMQDTVYGDERA